MQQVIFQKRVSREPHEVCIQCLSNCEYIQIEKKNNFSLGLVDVTRVSDRTRAKLVVNHSH